MYAMLDVSFDVSFDVFTSVSSAMADWIWSGDPNKQVSPKICRMAFPLTNGSCLSKLTVKGLGIAIIAGACFNKMPIMLNILNSKSAAGLSRTAVYGETICYANSFFYDGLAGHPLTAYGENGALAFQSIAIILLMWHFSESASKVSMPEQVAATVFPAVYIVGVAIMLPADWQYLLLLSGWPVLMYSRGSQIMETRRIQHPGAQSIFTTFLNLVGDRFEY
jgi:mannose-P-dolichol utilization defect protein 1